MGKIAPVSSKYIIHLTIKINGVVDKPDVIGAVFGQTEGLLGRELELRELQKNGRIGRIDVELNTNEGKTEGKIVIPSSLDKVETSMVAAAVETIQRIGPCDAELRAHLIEDTRLTKRDYVVDRAKELLKVIMDEQSPDSREMTDDVKKSFRFSEMIEYGEDRLPAGPDVRNSEEIILVEGRADVINLIKHGIKNVLGMNGTDIPQSIARISKEKIITVFLDGDRGGNLILKALSSVANIDYVIKAPFGREVEELTHKEIQQCIRSKKQFSKTARKTVKRVPRKTAIKESYAKKVPDEFKSLFEGLIGTKGAYLLGKKNEILGRIPIDDLNRTLEDLKNVKTVIMDGAPNAEILKSVEKANVEYLVVSRSTLSSRKVKILSHGSGR